MSWELRPVAGSKLTHPGVYCLRSNQTDWDAETMWRSYIMLTDLEAVFRSLKSELGLRPIFHQKQRRSNAHLFITVLAYQLVLWRDNQDENRATIRMRIDVAARPRVA